MYLFLVDYNFIASEQLQKMIEDISPGADIVNCFSAGTLLKVADKLKPDVMILDYDLIGEDRGDLLGELRAKNEQAHVLALIEPGSYDELYRAIEEDMIDDY
ncbi:MAG TPA: response regulator transcription factor, partial [Firmicutes bacterium]|nr:response regulator transcription factor [Bacillota bacterium]